jgi:hypothetical protein
MIGRSWGNFQGPAVSAGREWNGTPCRHFLPDRPGGDRLQYSPGGPWTPAHLDIPEVGTASKQAIHQYYKCPSTVDKSPSDMSTGSKHLRPQDTIDNTPGRHLDWLFPCCVFARHASATMHPAAQVVHIHACGTAASPFRPVCARMPPRGSGHLPRLAAPLRLPVYTCTVKYSTN